MVDTGEPVLLPFRMSSFVISNLVVTGGMLTPGLKVSSNTRIFTLITDDFADDRYFTLANNQSIAQCCN